MLLLFRSVYFPSSNEWDECGSHTCIFKKKREKNLPNYQNIRIWLLFDIRNKSRLVQSGSKRDQVEIRCLNSNKWSKLVLLQQPHTTGGQDFIFSHLTIPIIGIQRYAYFCLHFCAYALSLAPRLWYLWLSSGPTSIVGVEKAPILPIQGTLLTYCESFQLKSTSEWPT